MSTNDPRSTHRHILFNNPHPRSLVYKFESHSLYSLLNEPFTEAIKIDNPIKYDFPSLAGYCNGLVCLTLREYDKPMGVFFWNPFTRKIRRLPETIYTERKPVKFGLGYDESSDDFKLFFIAADHHDYQKKVSVYSSKSNSWKGIRDFTSDFYVSNGVFADGAVHWVTVKKNTIESQTIVSVNVKNEILRELVLPTTMDYWKTLRTFGNSLCFEHFLILVPNIQKKCDIWVLNECDVKESGTKVFSFAMNGLPLRPSFLTPLCLCVNGDILFYRDTKLYLYNSKDNTLKVLLHEKINARPLYTCVESLVSP